MTTISIDSVWVNKNTGRRVKVFTTASDHDNGSVDVVRLTEMDRNGKIVTMLRSVTPQRLWWSVCAPRMGGGPTLSCSL